VSVLEVPVSYNLARINVACIVNSLHREKKIFKTIRIQSKIYSDHSICSEWKWIVQLKV
jgi:hypothetical protein